MWDACVSVLFIINMYAEINMIFCTELDANVLSEFPYQSVCVCVCVCCNCGHVYICDGLCVTTVYMYICDGLCVTTVYMYMGHLLKTGQKRVLLS